MKSMLVKQLLPFDFDSHAAALRETGFDLILTSRARSSWSFGSYPLEHLTLEFRGDGGSAIVAGTSPADSIAFAVLSSGTPEGGMLNGQRIRPLDLIVVPPSQHLIQTTAGSHQWISAVVPAAALLRMEASIGESFARLMDVRRVLVLKSKTLGQKVVANAMAIENALRDGASIDGSDIEEREQSLTEMLSAAAAAAFERARTTSAFRGRKADSYELARRAVGLLHESHSTLHNVGDFCRALDATERQVRRTFNSFFGMGPARLARLHRLNRVRRRLVEGIPESMKIMNVLADCEVTEFGRFAGEYKTLFGEMPSETRRKHLIVARSNGSAASMRMDRG